MRSYIPLKYKSNIILFCDSIFHVHSPHTFEYGCEPVTRRNPMLNIKGRLSYKRRIGRPSRARFFSSRNSRNATCPFEPSYASRSVGLHSFANSANASGVRTATESSRVARYLKFSLTTPNTHSLMYYEQR